MIKRYWLLFLYTVLTLNIAVAQQKVPFVNIDNYVEQGLKQWRIPGLALAIVKDGKIVYAKGFGVTEIGKTKKVDENTIFAVGSNTKAFTATALFKLAAENKLSVDDKVIKYLPEFRLYDTVATNQTTIRDVLSHRFGLGTWHGDLVAYGTTYSTDEVIYRMRYIKPASAFRSAYGYSNVGFATAGAILAKVTNRSWFDNMKETFFVPLKMTRTVTSIAELGQFKNVATPHTLYNDKVIPVPYRDIHGIAAAGAINSTAIDMAHWLIMQLNEGTYNGQVIIKPDVLKLTHYPNISLPIMPYGNSINPSNHFAAYASGWRLNDYQGKIMIAHGGGVDGMTSQTCFLPEEKLGIVILTNTDYNNFCTPLLYQIIDAYLGVTGKDWNKTLYDVFAKSEAAEKQKWAMAQKERKANIKPTNPLQAYAGLYRNQHYGDARISYTNGRLELTLFAHAKETGVLSPWEKDTFLCMWNDPVFNKSIIPFAIVNNNKVQSFKLTVRPEFLDPLEYEFIKVE
jgi:CubicO group peptidase (beta-lactamase class C family)